MIGLSQVNSWHQICSIPVPFCYTVDLRAPSAIMEDPVISPLTPESTTLYHPDAKESRYTPTSETKSKRNLELGGHGAASNRGRGKSNVAGVN